RQRDSCLAHWLLTASRARRLLLVEPFFEARGRMARHVLAVVTQGPAAAHGQPTALFGAVVRRAPGCRERERTKVLLGSCHERQSRIKHGWSTTRKLTYGLGRAQGLAQLLEVLGAKQPNHFTASPRAVQSQVCHRTERGNAH